MNGHNGGPSLTFSARVKLGRIKDIIGRSDLTSAQKCVGVGIVVAADGEWASVINTAELQCMASAQDRETVFRATRALQDRGIITKTSARGQTGRFKVIPSEVVDAVIDAYHGLQRSRAKPVGPKPTSRVEADRSSRAPVPARIELTPTGLINNTKSLVQSREEPAPTKLNYDLKVLAEQLLGACNGALDNPANCSGLLSMTEPILWLDNGCDLERDILPTLMAVSQKAKGKRLRTWAYFTDAVRTARDRRKQGLGSSPPAVSDYDKAMKTMRALTERPR